MADPAASATPPAETLPAVDLSLWDSVKAWASPDNLIQIAVSAGVFLGIVLVGAIIGSILSKGVQTAIDKSKRQPSALFRNFVVAWAKRAVVILAIIVGLETIGVRTAPIIAGLGVAGFIIGFAVQGTLSNFASGMMILVYRPFDVGDVCELAGTTGVIKELTIVNTTILTGDNRTVIVPNSNVWGATIINITRQKTRRVDLTVSVSYRTDLDRCRQLLMDYVVKQPEVLKDPAPVVEAFAYKDSSIDFVVRPWVETAKYWDFYFRFQRELKGLLDAHGIEIPYPQRVVHMVSADKPA
jgi:small conductance mechanosensitive channel